MQATVITIFNYIIWKPFFPQNVLCNYIHFFFIIKVIV